MKNTQSFYKNRKGDGEPAPHYLISHEWITIRSPDGQCSKLLFPL